MFERFTDEARQVMVLAQEEARALGHNWIGTEHILLGLLRMEQGLAARVLESLEVTTEEARAQIVRIIGAGEGATAGQIPFTPRAKKVLELSLREALGLGHNYIGTEHILLGLVREEEGVAARVLLDLDADAERVRDQVNRALPERRPRPGHGFAPLPGVQSPRWEYRVETPAALTADWLNGLGAEGWELAAVAPRMLGGGLIFKRRLLGAPDPPEPGA